MIKKQMARNDLTLDQYNEQWCIIFNYQQWCDCQNAEKKNTVSSIKKISSALYVGSLEQGMRKNQIREPQDYQNAEIIVAIILYLNS